MAGTQNTWSGIQQGNYEVSVSPIYLWASLTLNVYTIQELYYLSKIKGAIFLIIFSCLDQEYGQNVLQPASC